MLPGPMRRARHASLALLGAAALIAAGCNGDSSSTTTTTEASSTTASSAGEQELDALLLAPDDLPAGFTESAEVDDTITSFCLAEDAAGGLQASARGIRGFTRTSGGASVIQLVFRFRPGDAERFVAQADDVLGRCGGVPDSAGLAFDYEPLSAELDALVAAAADSHTGRYGVNVGSGSLTLDVVVLQHGDIGELVAVLGIDLPRAELDALATVALDAATMRLAQDADAG